MAITLKQFDDAKSLQAVQLLTKTALTAASKSTASVKFVAAKNYQIGAKMGALFLVVDKPNDMLTLVKKKGGKLVAASLGEAKVTAGKKKGNTVFKVVIERASGALSANIVSTLIKAAAGDEDYIGTTEERQRAENEALAAEIAKRAKPQVENVAHASHKQARVEGKLDYEVKFTPELVKAMAKATLESAEFGKFNQNFTAFIRKYGLKKEGVDAGKLPTKMWAKLMEGLANSGYVKENIPRGADGQSYVVGIEGPEGRVVRERLLAQAMDGLQPFVQHAGVYMDRLIERAQAGSSYAFWSGRGADQASRRRSGITMNLGVGAFFDAYEGEFINFPKLTGVEDLPLWSALSEMYALRAANSVKKFKFLGFVGPTATRDQSVLNKIEVPTFLETLNARAEAKPQITWFVTDCRFEQKESGGDRYKGNKGSWIWTEGPEEEFPTQTAAFARLVARYER